MNFGLYNIDQSPFWQFSAEVRQICQPLLDQFGINYFDYSRFYPDNTCTTFFSSCEYLKFFLSQKNYRCPVGAMMPGKYLWHTYIDLEFLEFASQKFDHYYGITVIRQKDGYNELFNFAAPKNAYQVINFFLNYEEVLEYFINYFLLSCQGFLDKHKRTRIIIPSEIIDCKDKVNDKQNIISNFINTIHQKSKLLKNKYLLKVNDQLVAITIREAQCLALLMAGNTAKQIGKKLNISDRTVEIFCAKIIQKTHSINRIDLISKLDNNFLNLINHLIETNTST